MMARQKRSAPGGNRGQAQAGGLSAWRVYRKPSQADQWRDHLPDPASYYSARLPKLSRPNGAGWAQARCPFHEDRAASLSVNLVHGGWRCFAGCGQGDMVSFHERLTGMGFRDAVAELTGGAA
jgi:hypothetical protein